MDIELLIRTANPLPLRAAPAADSAEARQILRHVLSLPRRFGEPRTVPLRTLSFAGLVAVGLVVAVVLVILPGGPGGSSSSAAAALRSLARTAYSQAPTNPPGPGQYLYVRSESAVVVRTPSFSALQSEETQIWTGADGSGRIVQTPESLSFFDASEEAAWKAAGSPRISPPPIDQTYRTGGMAGPDLDHLSTDPTVLVGQLQKVDGGPDGSAERFVNVGDLLRYSDASPALRSALFQVASTLSGVDLLGPVTDHSGRAGIGVSDVNAGVENELIFDPSTSALIGEQQSAAVDDPPGYTVAQGTVLGWTVYQASTVVNSTDAVT